MAAVPSIGRAAHIEGAPAHEADLTRALYEEYAAQIFRYCLHQLGSREEAEDAVQSTFLNAFRGIKRGIVPELESAWLFKIAHNVCLSRRRTTWRRGRIESPTDFEVVEELTAAPSRRADELMGLQDVLEEMPESQRRAILLREWQGLSYREIAEELDLSQAAVETLIFRARRALAAGLEQPPERKRRVRGADFGNVLMGLKSLLLGGGAAVKVAATVAVVSASTVVAAAPVTQLQHHLRKHPARARGTAGSLPAQSAGTPVVATSAGPAARFPGVTVQRQRSQPFVAVRPLAAAGPADGRLTPDQAAVVPAPAPAPA
ncbi:MAG TPA: RNA polymerase sigma factor, partial [Gaiellaceae bacterium]|nr:RNA polymerase sigma factor [Gaiellaceae bacterium]